MDKDRDFLSRQLIKLGDMMGDGLHHEPDGYWIKKEYRKVLKALHPEIYAEKRKNKRKLVNIFISEYIKNNKSPCCNSELKQSRAGCKAVTCINCKNKFTFKRGKKHG